MSTTKLSFRARALDAAKPMAVFMAKELPDLPDFTVINRAVPQMPTGMEKEEETEHHLQRAIVTGLIIPTPEVYQVEDNEVYNKCYPKEWKVPRNLIHMQPFTMEQDIPDYDMDSDDEKWINLQADKLVISPLQFEEMMDRLEKSSGQTVITLNEAKSLFKQDDDFITAVYDYWLNKRLKTLNPLIPQVKTDKYGGSASSANPYIAFRRRTEKMQTRKHRKNDEASYEKMLKLRRDLSRALTLLEMVKNREKFKREVVHCGIEVYERRYQLSDYSGSIMNEITSQVKQQPRLTFGPLSTSQAPNVWPSQPVPGAPATTNNKGSFKDDFQNRKERRNYRKRKHKNSTLRPGQMSPGATAQQSVASISATSRKCNTDALSLTSEEETEGVALAPLSDTEEVEPDIDRHGPFTFRRKLHCNYLAPAPWPSSPRSPGIHSDPHLQFRLTSISVPQKRCVGFARRRIGRGGRVVLDRSYSPPWEHSSDDLGSNTPLTTDLIAESRNNRPHFAPVSTPFEEESLESSPSPTPPTKDSVIRIRFDDEDRDEIFDLAADTDRFDAGRDCIRVPPAEFSPPLVSQSNVNVVEDGEFCRDESELDWWNYFQVIDDNVDAPKPPKSPVMSVNKGPSSPIYVRVPKSTAIPNSDCSLASPCLGDMHSTQDMEPSTTVVWSSLTMEVT